MQTQWAVVVVVVVATVAEVALAVDSEAEEDSVVAADLADVELTAAALEEEAVVTAAATLVVLLLQPATQVAWKRRTHQTRSPTSQHLVARRIRSSTCET